MVPSIKLRGRWTGPYKILKHFPDTGNVTLELPHGLHELHPTFAYRLIKPHISNTLPNRLQFERPEAVYATKQGPEYEVDEVLDIRFHKRRWEYCIAWTGYPEPGWEPYKNLECHDLLRKFHEKYPDKPVPPPPVAPKSSRKSQSKKTTTSTPASASDSTPVATSSRTSIPRRVKNATPALPN